MRKDIPPRQYPEDAEDAQIAAHMIGLDYKRPYIRHGRRYYKPYRNYFGSALTDLQAAVTGANPTRYNFVPITFNEDVYITMTVTAAATGVSGTPSITTQYRGIARGSK